MGEPLATAEQAARFLAYMGYPKSEIVQALNDHYECEDPDTLATEAIDRESVKALAVDNQIARNARAVASEHDLDVTAHRGSE